MDRGRGGALVSAARHGAAPAMRAPIRGTRGGRSLQTRAVCQLTPFDIPQHCARVQEQGPAPGMGRAVVRCRRSREGGWTASQLLPQRKGDFQPSAPATPRPTPRPCAPRPRDLPSRPRPTTRDPRRDGWWGTSLRQWTGVPAQRGSAPMRAQGVSQLACVTSPLLCWSRRRAGARYRRVRGPGPWRPAAMSAALPLPEGVSVVSRWLLRLLASWPCTPPQARAGPGGSTSWKSALVAVPRTLPTSPRWASVYCAPCGTPPTHRHAAVPCASNGGAFLAARR